MSDGVYLNEMAVFAKVVGARSFTKAARELGLPKSTVSLRVTQLEERLGVRLLNRTTRLVTPTEAGVLYFERCQRIVADAQEADSLLRSLQSEPKGVLKLSTFPDLGYFLSERFLPGFLLRHPSIKLELHLLRTSRDALAENMDVGLQLGAIQDTSLFARRLGVIHRELFASPDYISRKGALKSPADAPAHDFIVQTREMSGLDRSSWELTNGRQRATLEVAGTLSCNSLRVMRNAAVAGVGIALLPPQLFRKELDDGSLRRALPGWRTLPLDVQALYPSKRFLTSKLKLFLEELQEEHLFDAP